MKIKVKTWLEENGTPIFGQGLRQLLTWVEQSGSLNKAAKEMRMSYRAAWGKIKQAEDRIGFSLLETHTGGSKGGGSCLTPEAIRLLKDFVALDKQIQKLAENAFSKRFGCGKKPPESK